MWLGGGSRHAGEAAGLSPSPQQQQHPHQQGLGRRGRKPAWADSWQQQQQLQQRQQQGAALGGFAQGGTVPEEDASSRASSPAKSPLLQGSPYLDQGDQPLTRQPPGMRAAGRLSQQGLGGIGSSSADLQQQAHLQPPSPLGRGPALPHWEQPEMQQQQDAPVLGGRPGGLGGRGTPPARLFGGGGGDGPSAGGGGGLFGAAAAVAAGAAPSDPMTYQMQAQMDKDGVPNMGDVQEEPGAPCMPFRQQQASHQQQQRWQIPAVHTTPGSGGSRQRYAHTGGGGGAASGQMSQAGGKRGLMDKKPGAAFKLGKRQAYTKYLAYEGCWQLCLEELMAGSNPTAATFLQSGCSSLKQALGLEELFLVQYAADPSQYTQDGMQCIWDDREDVVLAAEVPLEAATPGPSQRELQQQMYAKQQRELEQYQLELEQQQQRAHAQQRLEREMQKLAVRQEPLARVSGSSGGSGGTSRCVAGPALEVTVMRVVGCELLTNGITGRDFNVVTYAGSRPAGDAGCAVTKIGSDGNAHDQQVVRLPGDSGQQQTFTAELHVNGQSMALGTVQVAELHKIASQGDLLFDTAPSTGFLKSIFPCLRKAGGHQGSMAWVKLVDDEGKVAGHAVLSARISMAMLGAQGLMGPPSHTSERRALAEDTQTISITQLDLPSPPPVPMPMMPPMTSPMPPTTSAFAAAGLVTATAGKAPATATGGYLQVSSLQVYDELLESALKTMGCGPRNLALRGPWVWLLERFGEAYAVGRNYARLSYLKWVVRPENATLTADCFDVLLRDMVALQQAAAVDGLSSGELGVQAQVSARVEELLHTAFENYFMLSEETASGMMDGALAVRSGIPAVLRPAVHLFGLVRDATNPADQEWLAERFRVAARKRYQALLTAAELQRPSSPRRQQTDVRQVDSPEAVAAYGRLEELCRAIMNELRADDQIRDAHVLPAFINLPDLTALEYVNGIIKHLRKVLTRYPPPAPTEAAVRLVEAVGKLQNFVHRHKYVEANSRLNNRDIFGRFVLEWINSSAGQLSLRCRRLEQGVAGQHGWQEFASDGKNKVAQLVEDMLNAVQSEMGRYQRIITYWPMYGPDLERAVTGALREATLGVSRQCGLVQIKEGGQAPEPLAIQPYRGGTQQAQQQHQRGEHQRGGRTAWRWVQQPGSERAVVPATYRGAPMVLQQGINPNQALLLNSLRRLLQVSPQMEQELKRWCAEPLADSLAAGLRGAERSTGAGGGAAGDRRMQREAPNLGAQFAQLVKELRSEYFAAITLCAERLAAELAKMPATSVVQLLRRNGVFATTQQLSAALMRIMEEVEKLLHWLSNVLDNRVFVALTRGLWDLTSKDVLDYTEDLREGGGGQRDAWRGRQSAATTLAHMDNFFKTVLTSSMGNDLQNKDLALPQHSDRAHKLLADNDTTVHMSYDVY